MGSKNSKLPEVSLPQRERPTCLEYYFMSYASPRPLLAARGAQFCRSETLTDLRCGPSRPIPLRPGEKPSLSNEHISIISKIIGVE